MEINDLLPYQNTQLFAINKNKKKESSGQIEAQFSFKKFGKVRLQFQIFW